MKLLFVTLILLSGGAKAPNAIISTQRQVKDLKVNEIAYTFDGLFTIKIDKQNNIYISKIYPIYDKPTRNDGTKMTNYLQIKNLKTGLEVVYFYKNRLRRWEKSCVNPNTVIEISKFEIRKIKHE